MQNSHPFPPLPNSDDSYLWWVEVRRRRLGACLTSQMQRNKCALAVLCKCGQPHQGSVAIPTPGKRETNQIVNCAKWESLSFSMKSVACTQVQWRPMKSKDLMLTIMLRQIIVWYRLKRILLQYLSVLQQPLDIFKIIIGDWSTMMKIGIRHFSCHQVCVTHIVCVKLCTL